jgi:hypothetical protein
MESETPQPDQKTPPHPRVLGWVGTAALAMGGSNQMIFLITALFVGQEAILGQGSAAVPLLIAGVLLGWAAAPAWTELVLMWPNRVGGISAACAEAFRPYNPVPSALTGTCYWWGWVPTCGLTALLSASAFQQWYFPGLPVEAVAITIVGFFSVVNLCGIKWVARLAIPIATASASLAFISSLAPILAGDVNWTQAFDYHLTTPFEGWFGDPTSVMAGLYLIGFAAPAFEAAAAMSAKRSIRIAMCPVPCSLPPPWQECISWSSPWFGGASLPRAARHHRARCDRRLHLAARRRARVPAIRPPDGGVRPRLGLFGGWPLRLARHRGSAGTRPSRLCPNPARQVHRRHAAGARARRHSLSARRQHCRRWAPRARFGACRYFCGGCVSDHQRRSRSAGHDHLFGDRG